MAIRKELRFGVLSLLMAAAGCGSLPETVAPAAATTRLASKDARAAAAAEEAALAQAMRQIGKPRSDYRISAADLLDITVYGDQDLTRKVRVGQNGTVSMPLIGPVKLGGLTMLEAESVLNEKLKKYYVAPQTSLFIEDYGNKQIFVLGQVQKPGSYPIPSESRLTVLEAISTAGGFTPIAGLDRTRVLRNGPDGKSEILLIEVTAITKRGEKEKDVVLQPNDIVFIPQSFF